MIHIRTHKIIPVSNPCKVNNMITKSDIKHTSSLLADFLIFTDIPKFTTKSELYRWRDDQIRKKLNE